MLFLDSLLVEIALILTGISTFFYFLLTSTHDHWKKKNVPFIKPSFPFGNFGKLVTGSASITQQLDDFYKQLKHHGFGGVYNVREPVLVVCKPELIKYFLTKDFGSFHDRGIPHDEENDPFSANLSSLSGERWRVLRSKLSPTFTSGKIKGMFPFIQECTQELSECIEEEIKKKSGSVEMKDLLIRYTTDVIGTCAFGVNCNSIKNPEGEFHVMSREIFAQSLSNTIRLVVVALCPKLVKFFSFKRLFSKPTDFFTQLMDKTVKYRKENKVQRNDFVQLMMKIMEEESESKKFDQTVMAAQAFFFFVAGLDNVANNIGFCLHAMAVDPDLQEQVYQEIHSVLEEYDEKLCYEAVKKMNLVSRVLDEGLRMYTPAGALVRTQTDEKYLIPGTDVEIDKGTLVMIPTQSLHHDEQYFPNPQKFDPDRFTDEKKANRHPYAYLPFGEGPRFCIASRFANLEMRMCFIELLRQFSFAVAPETDLSLQLDIKAFGPTPINDFWLKVTKRCTK